MPVIVLDRIFTGADRCPMCGTAVSYGRLLGAMFYGLLIIGRRAGT